MANKNISIIAAVARNGAIGLDNKLLYWLPNDMKRFKALTTGNTIIMGRKTFESLPKGALPNRRNIVLSRTASLDSFPGAECFRSLEDALNSCVDTENVFIIGGESIYRESMDVAGKLVITEVDDEPAEADAFFPQIDTALWKRLRKSAMRPTKSMHMHTLSAITKEWNRLTKNTAVHVLDRLHERLLICNDKYMSVMC